MNVSGDLSRESDVARRLRNLSPEKRALLETKLREHNRNLTPPLGKRTDAGVHPLSFAQERLWFLWQLEPDSPAYNRPTFLRLTGTINLSALEQAITELTRRHEVLRAQFSMVDGVPQQ